MKRNVTLLHKNWLARYMSSVIQNTPENDVCALAAEQIQGDPINPSVNQVAVSYRKPASTGASCEGCRTKGCDKRHIPYL